MKVSVFLLLIAQPCNCFFLQSQSLSITKNSPTQVYSSVNENEEADEMIEQLRKRARELREQAEALDQTLDRSNRRQSIFGFDDVEQQQIGVEEEDGMSLKNKTVLVTGANGRLGSMVCRYLLRNFPTTQVVAAVHYVGEASTRGYGRLSYEVGAEDGVGSIGPVWSAEDRDATFIYSDDIMSGYNLQNLRVVEVELLDPIQCQTITEGIDSVIWCATDFDGNRPRSIASLNVAFLFRAVSRPDKGRVEIEGLQNILGGMKLNKQQQQNSSYKNTSNTNPPNVVLVSVAPDAYEDFVTPLGDFKALKRDGERILEQDFPSLSYSILQMSRFDDNFVEEGLDAIFDEAVDTDNDGNSNQTNEKHKRRINRRDAARVVCEALTDESLLGKKVNVYTAAK